MAQNSKKQPAVTAAARRAGGGWETKAPSESEVIAEVRRHLDDGQHERAIDAIVRAGAKSPWLTNALGVCQLRMRNGARAVEIFRGLVLTGGIHVREDVPPVFKLNFAAAMLATGNVDGFLSVLGEMGDDEHPSVARYREAHRRWRDGLSLRERIRHAFGGRVAPPLDLGVPLGDL